ncbi:hypothetical protein D3C73_1672660 [compost metagenome]
MRHAIKEQADKLHNKRYVLVEPSLSAVAGAVLIGFERLEIPFEGSVAQALARHPKARYQED